MTDHPHTSPGDDDRTRDAARERQEERELVTGGHPLVDDDVLEQPTDDREHDEGAGRDQPTPNPAEIAP